MKFTFLKRDFLRPKISLKAEIATLKQLSMYLSANLSLSEALRVLGENERSKKLKSSVDIWKVLVESGKTLSDALDDERGVKFREISLKMIALGEKSGVLAESLLDISKQAAKALEIRRKVLGAIIYPCVILIGTLGLVVALLVFVFPKIIPLFESLKVELPLTTKILIIISDVLSNNGLVVFTLALAFVVFIGVVYKTSARIRRYILGVALKIPIVGGIIKVRVMHTIFDSLRILMVGGEQLSESLRYVSGMINFDRYSNFLKESGISVSEGKNFSDQLGINKKLFPPFVRGFISAGEKTGNIAHAFDEVSEILASIVEDRVKAMTVAVEPILMLFMSLIVGFIALSIILPIYGITSSLQTV